MLAQRLITGPLLIAALLGLVWMDGWVASQGNPGGLVFLAIFAFLLIPLAAGEAASLLQQSGLRAPRGTAVFLSWCLLGGACAAQFLEPSRSTLALALLGPAVVFGLAMLSAAWGRRIEGAWVSASGLMGIAIWTGLLPAFWVLATQNHSAWLVAGLILVVKMGDIGAYFTGMSIGKHKLIPWLSPGKTIEGLIGALVFGGLAGLGLSLLSQSAADPQNQLCMAAGVIGGVALAFLGAMGDLVESLLKRTAGAKDSGTLLPGMGGILDVLDSPLATGPAAYLVLLWGTAG